MGPYRALIAHQRNLIVQKTGNFATIGLGIAVCDNVDCHAVPCHRRHHQQPRGSRRGRARSPQQRIAIPSAAKISRTVRKTELQRAVRNSEIGSSTNKTHERAGIETCPLSTGRPLKFSAKVPCLVGPAGDVSADRTYGRCDKSMLRKTRLRSV